MTVSQQLDTFIAENGGNERDALNVALARLELAEKELAELEGEQPPSLFEAKQALEPFTNQPQP